MANLPPEITFKILRFLAGESPAVILNSYLALARTNKYYWNMLNPYTQEYGEDIEEIGIFWRDISRQIHKNSPNPTFLPLDYREAFRYFIKNIWVGFQVKEIDYHVSILKYMENDVLGKIKMIRIERRNWNMVLKNNFMGFGGIKFCGCGPNHRNGCFYKGHDNFRSFIYLEMLGKQDKIFKDLEAELMGIKEEIIKCNNKRNFFFSID